jgi:hypothetical protein
MEDRNRVCRNCGAPVTGRFCGSCGQRYREKKETFGHLVNEFIGSFTSFDSRFFRTLVPLLTSPGQATRQYMAGRQASQLHPVRLYLFSSFVYFLCFFSCGDDTNLNTHLPALAEDSTQASRLGDNWEIAPYREGHQKVPIASDEDSSFTFTISGVEGLDTLIRDGVTPEQYIAMQDSLEGSRRDGFVKRYLTRRSLELYDQGRHEGVGLISQIWDTVLHNIPKTLFILLPLFALLLKLLYIRQRKFNYVDHAVFSLHYFSLVFILLLIAQFILDPLFGTSFFLPVTIAWLAVYLFIALKRTYGQGALKTLAKYLVLGFLFFVLFVAAFLVNFLFSAFVG